MTSHEIETQLHETAEALLRDKKVSLFLGYEKAALPFRTSPLFLTAPEQVERLVWNPFCALNLAVYLPRLFAVPANAPKGKPPPSPPSVGIVVKGCDARSVAVLIQERQVPRDKLVLVGVSCPGMVDRRKAEKALGAHEALGAGEDTQGNVHVVVEDGSEIALAREKIAADECLECRSPTPSIHDTLLGAPLEPRDATAAERRTAEVESMALDGRWAYFQEAFSRCIRCNACREACPMCYCKDCLLDQTRPRWVSPSADISDVTFYHLTRAFHVAGRCTECGACARACPIGIDSRLLIRKVSQEIETLYGYRPGEKIDATPPLSTFTMDDPQTFLTEP
jgi:ferredoxin